MQNIVLVGYWVLKNQVQEYKVYGRMRQMFDLDFMNNLQQVHGNNPWPIELKNHN